MKNTIGFNLTQVDVSLSGNRIACEMRTLAPYSGQVMITGYQNAVKVKTLKCL